MGELNRTIEPNDCALGLDIGGTKMNACVVTPGGKVVARRISATDAQRGGEAVAADALAMVQGLINEAGDLGLRPAALGISVCELVDRDGSIVSDFTLRWRDPTVLEPFRRRLPVVVEADSRAAALAEARFGAGSLYPSFLYVTIGTGISCSLVLDGVPYRGARGCTGTMATGSLSTLCSECGAISSSHLEQIASGMAIERRYERLLEGQTVPGAATRTAKDILEASEQGDAVARRIIEEAAVCVGSAVSLLVSVLDPHAVVVGGGLGSAAGLYWEALVRTGRSHIWSDIHRELPIVQGSLGIDAAAIGSATLAWQRVAS